MFWRMGKGEEYLMTLNNYFQNLTDREMVVYKLINPPPYEWTGFYD
jgi:acyl-homoserine lactone acylase PvdQ